uniref:Uncharacterized protein n=1 Tax=Spumella elongata TaxID=89044 RepID=A0A7S3LZM0_9STRA|mmetsp:Transcript_15847/g.27884  ORF Transcript_15847/g.27884 Transcript_15847/m.27884 type:complete len:814 (+) Transcript_15847:626-3067(+)
MRASPYGQIEVAKMLLAHPGIDVNLQNKGGDTALMNASLKGHTEIVLMLLAQPGIIINIQNKNGKTALGLAKTWEIRNIISGNGKGVMGSMRTMFGLKRTPFAVSNPSQKMSPGPIAAATAVQADVTKPREREKRSVQVKDSTTPSSPTFIHQPVMHQLPPPKIPRPIISAVKEAEEKKSLQTIPSVVQFAAEAAPVTSAPEQKQIQNPKAAAPLPEHSHMLIALQQDISPPTILEEIIPHVVFQVGKSTSEGEPVAPVLTNKIVEGVEVSKEEDAMTTIKRDGAALDAFLQSDVSAVLKSAGHINEMHLKLGAHERALHMLVSKKKECPSLFWFYPKKRELRNWLRDPLKCLLQDSLMMVVVCPVTLRMVKCGPDGLGWEISAPKAWVKKWGPAILFSIYVMQAAVIAGRMVGIPLPQLPSVGDAANALGLKCDVVTAGMSDVINQEQLMDSLSAFTSTTESVLGDQDAPMQALYAKMHLQQKQLRKQMKAITKGAPISPAKEDITLGTDMPTQMFEESYKSIHAFLTTGENAKLGKLEDQLRGSMERVMAADGDVEWVSVEAVEVWKQQHQLIDKDAVKAKGSVDVTSRGIVAVPPFVSPLPSPLLPTLTVPTSLACSWLAVRLRQKGVREELIWECEQKLVLGEDHSEEHLLAAMSIEHFSVEYLREVGIKTAGLQQKLLALHRELVLQYHPPAPSSLLPSSASTIAFASAETQAALEKKLEVLTSQLSKLEASSEKSGGFPVPGKSGGIGGTKGGLQQAQMQRTDSATSAINPRTGQLYTVDELVLEIQLMKSDIGTLATDVLTIKDFI